MSDTGIRQRLAAILAADVASYSRLMAADERATVAALDAARGIFRTHIESSQGRVIDMAGDSVLAVFETATGAVKAALAVQGHLNAGLSDVPEDRRMRFRIGVHLGDVIEKTDGTIYGDGVNIAARLEGLAEPGGITVSESIRTAVKGKVNTSFEDQGEQQVKNIADPVWTYRIVLDGADASPHAIEVASKPSIAVLPFESLSDDPEQEYFADGVVDDIITALSRVRWFFVIARNSSFTYKGKAVDIKRVGRELGVRYVLEGSLRKSGNRVRITAQLIEAENGRHVWADRFEGNLGDLFDLQDQITENVVGAIEPSLRLAEFERSRRRPTTNMQAYDFFLRAWKNLSLTSSTSGNEEAVRDLQKAIELDSDYSAAKALYGWAIQLRRSARGSATEQETNEAIRMAREALAAHRDDPVTLATSAWVLCFLDSRHDEAMDAIERALTLAPNVATVLNHAGWVNIFSGDAESAVRIFQRAMRLSPLDPQMPHILNGLAFAYLRAQKYDEALAAALRACRDRPEYVQAQRRLIVSLVEVGRLEEAKEIAKRSNQLAPHFSISWWERAADFKDQAFKTRYSAALRAAGVPE